MKKVRRCAVFTPTPGSFENSSISVATGGTILLIKNRGMETRLRSHDGKKCRRSFLVAIAITAMDGRTRAIADALHHPVCRRDIKGSTAPHRHFANIGADLLALMNHRTHYITRLIALHPFGLLGPGAWKAERIHQAHLPTSVSCGDDA